VGESIFLNLAAECLFNFDYSIHKIFRDVNSLFHLKRDWSISLKRDWSKEQEVYHLQ